ncbi:MAG: FAD-dependent oxidoreductase, partial [Candidatus Altiarchaeota archaeon]|nr:FAD-dependent oxidoreductase [Candidatus Altiarchaeota archaeon]
MNLGQVVIVVIGGGFGGLSVVKGLEKKMQVTLIDKKSYFEFTPGILRAIVNPDILEKMRVSHKSHLQARFIQGNVSEVKKDHVVVNGKSVYFDTLVIATGARPRRIDAKAEITGDGTSIKNHHKNFVESKDVLIIGGGYVGVELAGEIVESFPDKRVTIVHSRSKLMHLQNLSASKYAERFLQKRGVKIILNKKIVRQEENIYFTEDGRRVKADSTFNCAGTIPNSEIFKNVFELGPKGHLVVNSSLHPRGFDNI